MISFRKYLLKEDIITITLLIYLDGDLDQISTIYNEIIANLDNGVFKYNIEDLNNNILKLKSDQVNLENGEIQKLKINNTYSNEVIKTLTTLFNSNNLNIQISKVVVLV